MFKKIEMANEVKMDRITMFDHTISDIDLYTRSVTPGDELDLVREFIHYYSNYFLKNNKNNNLAIFVEPKISSGFPDIVFAVYSPQILDYWSDEREKITTDDMKVMSHLILSGGCTGTELMKSLGLSETSALQSIERLLDANMILRLHGEWKPADLKKTYCVKKLISVEAKIANPKKAAEQSLINTWFASQSYALINTANPQRGTISSFERWGIGLYCHLKGFRKIVEAQKLKLPSSYLSLQFNEWIGRTVAHQC